ncbi:hypothetical protein KJ782_07025 [Patescibacteria group bacterium]|nr:hypothetical protein [Patescibacteria group bacterium]
MPCTRKTNHDEGLREYEQGAHRTPTYLCARDAIALLPSGQADRAAAEVIQQHRFASFLAREKVIQSRRGGGRPALLALGGAGSRKKVPNGLRIEDWYDHVTFWNGADGKLKLVAAQPYRLDTDSMANLLQWCRALSLRAHISAEHSWYFPGRSILVLLQRDAR